MSRCARSKLASDLSKSIICELPIDILHKILELVPIKHAARTSTLSKQWRRLWSTQPHLTFDPLFFQYVSNIGASAASIIHKILMQHTGNVLGFHLISETHKLSQLDVDQRIILVSNHGVQKLTLDMANDEKYVLPDSIFTCAMLTHLKLSRCIFRLPVDTQFPSLFSLKLEHSEIVSPVGSKNTTLILPMLETLELKFCVDVDSVDMVSPKLVNLSILTSYTITFECFSVNPTFERIKHLCLDGSSLKVRMTDLMLETLELKFCVDVDSVDMVSPKLVNLSILSSYTITFECFSVNPTFERIKNLCLDGSSLKNLGLVHVPDMLDVSLNLQSLRICNFQISVKRITCALCLLRNSPNLVELDIDEVVKVNETICHTDELLDYLSEAVNEVSEALRMIRTVRLRKFKGTTTEMCLIKVMLALSPELERLIIEQCKKSNAKYGDQHLKELASYPRASPNAETKYI